MCMEEVLLRILPVRTFGGVFLHKISLLSYFLWDPSAAFICLQQIEIIEQK